MYVNSKRLSFISKLENDYELTERIFVISKYL